METGIMSINRRSHELTKSALLACGMLCLVAVSGCSNSNSNQSNGASQNSPLASCAVDDSCASNPTLQIGQDRPADVLIPFDYTTSTRYPLIISLHGFGATGFLEAAYMGFIERIDKQQYVLVTPDGTENLEGQRFWNATPACCAPSDNLVDDVAYIRSLIVEAAATYSIDVSRISLFGHSNGGFMALRMACEASGPRLPRWSASQDRHLQTMKAAHRQRFLSVSLQCTVISMRPFSMTEGKMERSHTHALRTLFAVSPHMPSATQTTRQWPQI